MPAEGRENHLLKKGNSDAFFREKYLTKNSKFEGPLSPAYFRRMKRAHAYAGPYKKRGMKQR